MSGTVSKQSTHPYEVVTLIDDDGHLNIFVSSPGTEVFEIETGQGTNNELAFRVTTALIEGGFDVRYSK